MTTPKRAYTDVLPPVVVEREETASGQVAPDDPGRLPEATRRVLLQLLKGPYILRSRHPKLWPALVVGEAVIRERLGDLFLVLVLDHDRGLAFVRNFEAPEVEVPKVIRSAPLTLIDTALVLFLREHRLKAEATADRVYVGRDEIDDHLGVYQPDTGVDAVAFGKRVNASVNKMKEASVLLETKEPDRFEVSSILDLVFDADEVLAVTRELRALVGEDAAAPDGDEEDGDDDAGDAGPDGDDDDAGEAGPDVDEEDGDDAGPDGDDDDTAEAGPDAPRDVEDGGRP